MKKQKKFLNIKVNRGFTLIELLVVVAIIATLAGVVLASLNSARVKGIDSSIKEDLSSLSKQAIIYYGNNNESFGVFAQATCPNALGGGTDLFRNDSKVFEIINHAVNQGGNGSSCSSSGVNYAVAVGLKTAGISWCVDSTGMVKSFSGTPSASITSNRCN